MERVPPNKRMQELTKRGGLVGGAAARPIFIESRFAADPCVGPTLADEREMPPRDTRVIGYFAYLTPMQGGVHRRGRLRRVGKPPTSRASGNRGGGSSPCGLPYDDASVSLRSGRRTRGARG